MEELHGQNHRHNMLSEEQIKRKKLEREALKIHIDSLKAKKVTNELRKIDNKHLNDYQRKMRRLIVND